MRLQKFLAHAGIGSRRKCEEYIGAGLVTVNGAVVTDPATKVDPENSEVRFQGKLVRRERKVHFLLNKPAGYLSTVSDPQGRPTVVSLLKDVQERLYPVGRLDFDTEGLLMLTNDGELANLLTHPRYEVPKTYHARVVGVPSQEALTELRKGVLLEDGKTAPAVVKLLSHEGGSSLISLTLREGKKREVKRMLRKVGHPVTRLKRVAIGFLTDHDLPVGSYRPLTREEIEKLRMIAES